MKKDIKIRNKLELFTNLFFVLFGFAGKSKNNYINNPNYNRIFKKISSVIIIVIFFTLDVYKYFKDENNAYESDIIKYDIVIPINSNDTHQIKKLKYFLRKYISFNNIIIISQNNTKILDENDSFIVIDEDQLVPKNELVQIFINKGVNDTSRVGWYEQQFIKMGYARICKNDYYLIWDSDTIPIKLVKMFNNGFPIFDMKIEHHPPYFSTLDRLIPDLKYSKFSYISEHMIIKTEFMNNLLDKIEKNNDIPGKIFWEKILLSIDNEQILQSGFSEFETYGTFVDNYYKNYYKHRIWSSMRETAKYFGNIENLNKDDLNWLSKDYNAITFEKWDIFEVENIKLVKNLGVQKKCSPKRLFKYSSRIIKNYNLYKR